MALAAAVGAVKVLKWWLSGSEIGPAERVTLKDGETPREHLRQKVHEQMGGNYGPHDDLHEQAYVRDRHGNLRPYNP